MEIAALRRKITIQKQTAEIDEYANHINAWVDYFTCWCTPGGESGSESEESGVTQSRPDITFTVRWSSEIDTVETSGYRVIFDNTIYNITSIDHQNFKRKSVKLKCEKVER